MKYKTSKHSAFLTAGALMACLTAHVTAGTLQEGLVVHLPFDGTLDETTQSGAVPEMRGQPTLDQAGKVGSGALKFFSYAKATDVPEGQEQFNYVTLGSDTAVGPLDLSSYSDFSVSFWVKFNSWTGDPSFFGNKNWGSGGNVGFVVATAGDGRLQWNYRETGNGAARRDYDGPGGTLSGGSWHHVAVTFKRDGNITSYIDGALVNSSLVAQRDGDGNPVPGSLSAGLSLNLGQDGTGSYTDGGDVGIADGMMDDVGIWTRELNASEVGRIFAAANQGINLANVPDPTTPIITASSPNDGEVGTSPDGSLRLVIEDAGTKLKISSVKVKLDGAAVTPSVTEVSPGKHAVTFTPAALLGSKTTHKYDVEFTDDGAPAKTKTFAASFTVADYYNWALGTPLYLETFDGTTEAPLAEGTIPEGWTVDNFTDSKGVADDLNSKNSDIYKNFTIVTGSRALSLFGGDRGGVAKWQVVNGKVIDNLMDGQICYGNSDGRSGNVYQILRSPVYDLTGKQNIYVGFNSIYEQNQDSLGALEYTVDEGQTWYPVLYLLKRNTGDDLVYGENGLIDGAATLSKPQGDAAKYTDPNTGSPTTGNYGSFIAVPEDRWSELGPYISGRIDDDAVGSKRYEAYRLPLADGQSKVQLRFAHSGTDSWYWGLDNVGIYSAALSAPKIDVVKTGDNLSLSWKGSGVFEMSESLDGPWTTITAVENSYSTTVAGSQKFFRLVIK